MEASYIIFLLQPYWENFNKRITKTPKLYFYDTGLAASLLDIKTSTELANSIFRGPLFESLIISDLYKQYFNLGQNPPLYFWRDKNGEVEVDCLINQGGNLKPIEIKSGQTSSINYFKALNKWCELTNTNPQDSLVIYGGLENQTRSIGKLFSWQNIGDLINKI